MTKDLKVGQGRQINVNFMCVYTASFSVYGIAFFTSILVNERCNIYYPAFVRVFYETEKAQSKTKLNEIS